jgi:hypothetical protein
MTTTPRRQQPADRCIAASTHRHRFQLCSPVALRCFLAKANEHGQTACHRPGVDSPSLPLPLPLLSFLVLSWLVSCRRLFVQSSMSPVFLWVRSPSARAPPIKGPFPNTARAVPASHGRTRGYTEHTRTNARALTHARTRTHAHATTQPRATPTSRRLQRLSTASASCSSSRSTASRASSPRSTPSRKRACGCCCCPCCCCCCCCCCHAVVWLLLLFRGLVVVVVVPNTCSSRGLLLARRVGG